LRGFIHPAFAMTDQAPHTESTTTDDNVTQTPKRQRMKPGERRLQILQMLASMLETPHGERVTTASLSARLGVSEAALYRHFASKAQMFEGLIDFIDNSLNTLIQQIVQREVAGAPKVAHVVSVVLQFAEKNPGMTRVMVGDALVLEDERLQQRINQIFDRLESVLRQILREAVQQHSPTPTVDANAQAAALVALVVGCLQRFVRSGFKRSPVEHLSVSMELFTHNLR
jgi:TetR/AcrR family transcriptional regulator